MLRRHSWLLGVATGAVALSVALAYARAQNAANTLEGELRDLTWVGFQQFQEASRAFVRTSDPVRYHIESSRDNVVDIILENTRVPVYNNTRYLDTHFFESPVIGIQPRVIEGPSPSVRISIYLRRKVPYRESQKDNVIALDFQRPQAQQPAGEETAPQGE